MSYESIPQNPATDRVLRLIEESDELDAIWVRTLNLSKGGVTVIGRIERFKALGPVVHAARRVTISNFYKIYRHTMQGTSSIDGWMMSQLTETKIKHSTDIVQEQKKDLFGGKK